MRRRDLLLSCCGAAAAAEERKPREWVTAAASRDTAPRVGLIPSTFRGSVELDGRKIRGLARPAPINAPLTADQLDDMLRLAVELGGGRRGGLFTAVGREDWVVIKIAAPACPGDPSWHPGMVTDPRLVAALLGYLARRGLGARFSIVEAAPCRAAIWESRWMGRFDGLTYRALVDAAAKQHPSRRFELIDLNTAPALEMPVEGRVLASRNPGGMYRVPRVLRECDRVISVAPLAAVSGAPVALSILNYLGFSPGMRVGELGEPGEVALDLFGFHPADYAILGGSFAAAWAGSGSAERRHNVLIAGTNAPAVDAVGAAVMGFDSTAIRHLNLAVQRGYGPDDAYAIWTRGAEIDSVRVDFRPPPA